MNRVSRISTRPEPGQERRRTGAGHRHRLAGRRRGTDAARHGVPRRCPIPNSTFPDRGVEGAPPAPPVDLFVATDRGAYRVGETVNATVLVRNAEARAIDNLP